MEEIGGYESRLFPEIPGFQRPSQEEEGDDSYPLISSDPQIPIFLHRRMTSTDEMVLHPARRGAPLPVDPAMSAKWHPPMASSNEHPVTRAELKRELKNDPTKGDLREEL
jgi:hypothetical protein